jgi:hypothetical protein
METGYDYGEWNGGLDGSLAQVTPPSPPFNGFLALRCTVVDVNILSI